MLTLATWLQNSQYSWSSATSDDSLKPRRQEEQLAGCAPKRYGFAPAATSSKLIRSYAKGHATAGPGGECGGAAGEAAFCARSQMWVPLPGNAAHSSTRMAAAAGEQGAESLAMDHGSAVHPFLAPDQCSAVQCCSMIDALYAHLISCRHAISCHFCMISTQQSA